MVGGGWLWRNLVYKTLQTESQSTCLTASHPALRFGDLFNLHLHLLYLQLVSADMLSLVELYYQHFQMTGLFLSETCISVSTESKNHPEVVFLISNWSFEEEKDDFCDCEKFLQADYVEKQKVNNVSVGKRI